MRFDRTGSGCKCWVFTDADTGTCGEHLEWGGWGASGLITPYPNPFSNGVTSPFLAGPQGSDVQIEMIDIMGKTVKSLANGHFGSGLQTVQWDANDASGNRVPQGLYLCQFRTSAGPAQAVKLIVK